MSRRLLKFCVPSILGACASGLAAGFVETALHTQHLFDAVAGVGFTMLFALPIGALLSLLGRALVQSWNFTEMLKPMRDERGASPYFCAWLIYLLIGSGVLWGGTYRGILMLLAKTRMPSLIAMSAPVIVVGILALLVAVSKPGVRVIETGLRGIEIRRSLLGKKAIVKPMYLTLTIGMGALVVLIGGWQFILLPKIGHLDLTFVRYLGFFAIGIVGFPVVWQRISSKSSLRTGVSIILIFTLALGVVCAQWARYKKPYAMLEIWSETQISGWAIDTVYDVQSLRVGIKLDGLEPVEIPGAPHPNIVLITIDTLRADRVPLYGGSAKMPALKKWGKGAKVFDHAFSPGNVTRRSIPTIVSGLSPSRVHGRVVGWALRIDPRHIMLAERFRAGNYDTAGFFCCSTHFGRKLKLGLARGMEHVGIEYDALPLAIKTSKWLRARGPSDKPLFLWTHYIEPHNWNKDHKPGPTGRTKNARYNLSLAATDDALEELFKSIRETLGDNTIIVVTADHGEGLGDHGSPHHSLTLYNSEIKVPLVISGPGIAPGRITQAVGLVDLAPTLLELAGFVPPGMPQIDGLSVAPELLGKRADALGLGEAYSQMVVDRSVSESRAAIISGRFKLISRKNDKYQLFDMVSDPRESKDIKEVAPLVFESMKARLERRKSIDRVPPF